MKSIPFILGFAFFQAAELFSQSPSSANPPPQPTAPTNTPPPQELATVEVTGKAEDLLGEAPAASKGQADSVDLLSRPMLRKGELMEAVPGMIVTQHAGDGKANQYFLRGFNLDHGTDFATDIEGMPMNMRTHAHGQGYTDLNPIVPELVDRLDYVKGTYEAANGDLSSAGSATFHFFDALPHNFATVEIGEHNYYRGALGGTISLDAKPQPILDGKDTKNPATGIVPDNTIQSGLTIAGEFIYNDGPWDQPEHAARENVFVRYFNNYGDDRFSVTFMGYHGKWTSTDQIAERAITEGLVGRFGTLNPTDGGTTQRYGVNVNWEHTDGDVITKMNVYGFYYDLNLFSDFTYFLNDPVHGDQFNQAEKRWVVGGNVSRTWQHQMIFGKESDYAVGFQTRNDFINPIGLYNTEDRQRLSTVRQDRVFEGNYSIYAEDTTRWTPWFRTNVGLRADVFDFDVTSNLPANNGNRWNAIISPKFSAIFGPWHDTEFYANWGLGFHTDDARGVNTVIDPSTGAAVGRAASLVRTQGAEIGMRTQAVPHLTSTIALFYLHLDSELAFAGDEGSNEPGPPSNRYGIEFANYWRPNSWLSVDAEIALTHARYEDVPPGQNLIPQSVPVMFSGGINLGAQGYSDGFFMNLRARAFGERPLDDNAFYDRPSFLVNGGVGYRYKHWEAVVECLNIFNRKDNDIEYYYTSRLPGEPLAGVNDVHLHPTEPREFRFRLAYHF